MYFTRDSGLVDEMCSEMFSESNQTIPVFLSDSSIHANKLLLHILSKFKLEDKTDALLLPDISTQDISCLLKAVVQRKSLETCLENHRFWLDSKKYHEIENLGERCRTKRLKLRGEEHALHGGKHAPSGGEDIPRGGNGGEHIPVNKENTTSFTTERAVILKHKDEAVKTQQNKSSPLYGKHGNTTIKIIQKNLDIKLNIDDNESDMLYDTGGHDLAVSGRELASSGHDLVSSGHDLVSSGHDPMEEDGPEDSAAQDPIKSPTDFVPDNLLSFTPDFTNEQDVDPLAGVLLDQDEDLFPNTVDISDVKIIIAGHHLQDKVDSFPDRKEITKVSPSKQEQPLVKSGNPLHDQKKPVILSPSLLPVAPVHKHMVDLAPSDSSQVDLPPSLTVIHKKFSRVVQICDICDKQFSDRSTLKRHIKSIHSNEKNYTCDVCLKSFSLQSYLTQHMQTRHTEPRTWICDFCGTKLRSRKGMQTHLLIHQEGSKNIPCELCSSKFRHKSTLVKHMKRVHPTDTSTLACEECDKTFTHNEGLKRHRQKIHGSLRPYECQDCSKTFAFQYELNRHKKLKSCARKRAVTTTRHLAPVNMHVVLTEDPLDF